MGYIRRRLVAAALVAVLMTQAGCATKAELRIIQAKLTPPQDVVRLSSAWAYVSDDVPGVERLVLMFPLPGARAGDRQFFIYLRVPGTQSKPIRIGDPLPNGEKVAGFLIQATGRFAGKTLFTKGTIELTGVAFGGGMRRQGKIAFHCADDSLVDGEFTAIVSPLEVTDFEEAKAGDVRALIGMSRPPTKTDPGEALPGTGLGPIDSGKKP
ncbi:MAG: hypothetical protein JXQ73_15785 [Phycisphaerae bacterium]|nr:hypothetical protein [Phycisphaerae bacterium]